jgi:hypothetical protein
LLGDDDVQAPGQVAHLPFEVSLEIVVVQEHQVGSAGGQKVPMW